MHIMCLLSLQGKTIPCSQFSGPVLLKPDAVALSDRITVAESMITSTAVRHAYN